MSKKQIQGVKWILTSVVVMETIFWTGVFALLLALPMGGWGVYLMWKDPDAKQKTTERPRSSVMENDYVMDQLREALERVFGSEAKPSPSDAPAQEEPKAEEPKEE